MNHLYFGDCLDVLKEISKEHPQPFIDLIYIDPPFNSKRNYNVLFESIDSKDANAQKQAFADTWSNYSYMEELNEMAELHKDIYTVLKTFHDLKSISDSAVAYLTTMAIRIYYMHRLLKNTGIFLPALRPHHEPLLKAYL
jgi:site-specific DNA-methyltransferase (adenine-specific)